MLGRRSENPLPVGAKTPMAVTAGHGSLVPASE
jgi:hypothetical protein